MTSSSAATAALEFTDVSCSFPDRGRPGQNYTAVRRASLSVGDGEFVALVGPTGCGKSTLLNVAAGLLAPTDGDVRAFGQPLIGINHDAGYLFQPDSLFPWRNALDNVAAGLEFRGARHDEARLQARAWLARVGLQAHAAKYPHELSGGMRKRVALAQIWILRPKVLLMDEPFSALDVQTRQLMENELLSLWADNRASVLFVTHDLEEAIALADRVVVLAAGPESHPIAQFTVDLPRPRDVAEIGLQPRFLDLHRQIWQALKAQVLAAHARASA
ncbi:MAG TPA: ABC transporter ATP-binding protein [Burkholderiales bacterium]|nr:ABC transporter ATP-binding protein [Burkholderiales bacterium]